MTANCGNGSKEKDKCRSGQYKTDAHGSLQQCGKKSNPVTRHTEVGDGRQYVMNQVVYHILC